LPAIFMLLYRLNQWVLILVLLTGGCTATKRSQSPSKPLQSQKPLSECDQIKKAAKTFLKDIEQLEPVTRLHQIEKKLVDPSTYHPTGCFDAELRKQMDIEASRLVYLSLNDSPWQKYQTEIVFDCGKLEGLICRGYSADDTAHTLEFPEAYQAISLKAPAKLKVNVDPRYSLTQMEFYTGNHDAMHGAGNPEKLAVQADGTLDFQFFGSEKEQVLFAIVKGKGDRLYKKYVWVVSR
jgi:hypothetical protein